jgi:hypothetical protein
MFGLIQSAQLLKRKYWKCIKKLEKSFVNQLLTTVALIIIYRLYFMFQDISIVSSNFTIRYEKNKLGNSLFEREFDKP